MIEQIHKRLREKRKQHIQHANFLNISAALL